MISRDAGVRPRCGALFLGQKAGWLAPFRPIMCLIPLPEFVRTRPVEAFHLPSQHMALSLELVKNNCFTLLMM
jgi:hypothetical protein